MVQCAKFHFWVTPDFLTKSGVTFNKKIGIGIGSQNREWLLQLTQRLNFQFKKSIPILTPDPENLTPDRDREPFRESFRE